MQIRRMFLAVVGVVLATGTLRAQDVNLTEAPLVDKFVRNELTLELEGKIHSKQDGKEQSFPHKASAKHVFVEKYLDAKDGIADKAARHYRVAESVIRFNNNEAAKRSLRAERQFVVAQRAKDLVIVFSPKGMMTREEMEVTEHLDTLAVGGLLPGKSIAVGKSWSVANRAVAALCEFDGLTEQNLEGTLESVKDDRAVVKIVGKAQGINLGAQVTMLINARLEFDVKLQRVVYLEWKETDDRQQGPVSPAMSAEIKIQLNRTEIEEPKELTKFALVPVPTSETPPANLTSLHYVDAKKHFEVTHARNWHVVSPDDSPQFVLRLIERGEFVAQATFTTWKKTDKAMKLEEFAALVAKTPGWVEDKEIERKEIANPTNGNQTIYRVAASGDLAGIRTVQYYYLIVGPRGDQLIVTFSVVPQHVQRLGARDVEMVREIAFPEMK
ncbi:MAG TPA: hypothetical protein VFE62_24520 [Gemmataceae bacterium]|nr:hypothetical protein [Gemmataceae bacterium]